MRFFQRQDSETLQTKSDSGGVGLAMDRQKFEDAKHGRCGERLLLQLATLRSLEEQGLAEELPNGYYIETEIAVQLDPETREQLGLPPPWPGFLRLTAEGNTARPDFRIRLTTHLGSGAELGPYTLKGPLLRFSETELYLPDRPQWLALSAAECHAAEVRSSGQLSETRNLQAIAQIQAAGRDGAEIDLGPFSNLEVVEPESVSISMTEQESGDAILTPNFGTGDAVEAIDNRLGQVKGKDEGSIRVGDRIIVLNKQRMRGVKELIKNRRVRKDQVETFLKCPSAFVDAALVDLDVGFSARVKGATIFRLAYFGETEATGNEWFGPEGDTYSGPIVAGRLNDFLKDYNELDDFEASFEKALAAGAAEFSFGDGQTYRIDDPEETRSAIARIRERMQAEEFSSPDELGEEPQDSEKEDESEPEKVVVDIETHDETATRVTGFIPPTWQDALDNSELEFSNLKLNPYSYQMDGIRWIVGLSNYSFNRDADDDIALGALLADDMGLGKTFMSLSAIAEYYRRCSEKNEVKRPVLVVAPLSLLENWQDEVDKVFATSPFNDIVVLQANADLKRFRIEGAGQETRQNISSEDEDGTASIRYALKTRASNYEVDGLDQPARLVLTTYRTLQDYQFSLCRIDWSFVIFDEAQNIKNPNALQTRAAKGLKARFTLAMTGTPVENELRDFWCLFDTARPGLLGSYQWFRQTYVAPIRGAGDEEKNRVRIEVGQALRNRAAGLMLRRLKEDNLDGLPQKTIWVGTEAVDSNEKYSADMECTMAGLQKDRYDMVVGLTRAALGEEESRGAALKGLQALRAISLHPDCIEGGSPTIPSSASEARQEIAKSAKLSITIEALEKIRERNEKVIIFCINKGLQKFLQIALEKIYSVPVHVINGDTKAVATKRGGTTRKKLIKDFETQDGFAAIIMSPIAAGVGLTVVGANNVIHLERHWNPAKENQATDRVYRIGQEKPVNVYVPVLKHPEIHSFDENLARLLGNKVGLRDAIVTPDDVTPAEIVNSGVFGGDVESKPTVYVPEDLENLPWNLFEALVAELLAREHDAETHLTPTNDYGCDVVVLSSNEPCRLIQCKHTAQSMFRGHSPITEIVGARPYYEKEFGTSFESLEVYTNAAKFDSDAKSTASASKVTLHGYARLKKLLKKHGVTDADVYRRSQSHWKPVRSASSRA